MQSQGVSNGMLFPKILKWPPYELTILHSISDSLNSLLFVIAHLGGGIFISNAIPDVIKGLNPI